MSRAHGLEPATGQHLVGKPHGSRAPGPRPCRHAPEISEPPKDVPDWLRWAGSLSRLVVIGTSVLAVLVAIVLLFALGVAAFD